MQTRTAATESASRAQPAQPFFAAQPSRTPAFFTPVLQAKCTACAEEESERAPLLQAKCAACNEEERTLQPKLTIGAPGDRYEQEADRMADAVMHTASPGALSDTRTGEPSIQRLSITAVEPGALQRDAAETCSIKDEPKEEGEEDEETEDEEPAAPATTVSPKRAAGDVSPPADLESRIDRSRGGGSPLPPGTRDFMESRFDYDFSSVRVHTGSMPEHLNRDVRSLAFTTGTDIYFGAGQYRPDTEPGRHLLAHELTHVIQQTGSPGGGTVREKSDPTVIARATDPPEHKWYYSHRIFGTQIHAVLERILRNEDPGKDLVTEAAIAGANRNAEALNKIGIADLYKSTPKQTVTGVKGIRDVDKEADVIGMNNPTATGTMPATVASGPVRTSGKPRGWRGDFPEDIWIGEIKPWSTTKGADGWAQLDHYEQGYQAFVRRVHTISGGLTRSSVTFHRLNITLPPRLDFEQWQTQHAVPSPDTTFAKDRRIWVARLEPGVYLYTDFAKSLTGPPPEMFSVHLTKMRKVRDHVATPHPKTDRMGHAKFVQRNTKDRPANYWPERGREWEKERADFAKGFRGALKTTLKNHREKVRFEKKLGRAGRVASAAEKKEVKEYKDLMFWSGTAGKVLGRVRFLLGGAWDRVLGVFEKMKEKMTGIRAKVRGLKETGLVKVGWASRLIQVVVAACKVAFSSFITESFNFFADCFHSAMDTLVERFKAEANAKFGEEICRARKLFEESKAKLETEWGEAIKQIEGLVDAVQNVKRWMDIATTAVDLIRVGVQVVSCLTPPGLGCLWGLVAQLGIGAMVGLVIGTQWFNDEIVTPNVRQLVRTYIAPHYQKLINSVLGEGLKQYHCHVADNAIPSMNFEAKGGLPNGSAALRAHRDAWEAEHEPEIIKDLQAVFGKPGGKKVTREELLELAKLVQDNKLSMEDLKNRQTMQDLLEQSRDPASGKLDLEAAKRQAEKTEAPAPVAKERTIDYPKARKQNAIYQKMRGWDPVTFVKKPGIKVDSNEFAEAVYDMQEALHIKADGILGDKTLVAFYDRNKKKADTQYMEATRAIAEQKAAEAERKAAREKAAAEKAAAEKGGVPQPAPLPASVKVLHANQALPDGKAYPFPKGVRFQIANAWSYLKWTDNPRTYDVKAKPQYISVDVLVDKVHEYRIEYVAVKDLSVAHIAVTTGGFSEWELFLIMEDGIQVTTSKGVFTIQSTSWGLP